MFAKGCSHHDDVDVFMILIHNRLKRISLNYLEVVWMNVIQFRRTSTCTLPPFAFTVAPTRAVSLWTKITGWGIVTSTADL